MKHCTIPLIALLPPRLRRFRLPRRRTPATQHRPARHHRKPPHRGCRAFPIRNGNRRLDPRWPRTRIFPRRTQLQDRPRRLDRLASGHCRFTPTSATAAKDSATCEIRLKHNLWGNDDGSTALAVMPFIKLPTANGDLGNGEFEGGLIVPFGFEGPAGWACAVMAELDLEADDDGSGHHLVGLTSATASHAADGKHRLSFSNWSACSAPSPSRIGKPISTPA